MVMKIENSCIKYIKLREKLDDSKIYKIVDTTNNNIYIGSTCKSSKTRLIQYKSPLKRFLKGLYNNVSSFQIIKNNNYKIELLENCIVLYNYNCINKIYL